MGRKAVRGPTAAEQAEFARWREEMWARCQTLRAGDLIRFVRMPSWSDVPWVSFHTDTRRLYRKLLARTRPTHVAYIDEFGGPWIRYRFRDRKGRMERHHLLVNDDSWVKVKKRKARSSS